MGKKFAVYIRKGNAVMKMNSTIHQQIIGPVGIIGT
jgi:hypothetical protein